MKWVVGLLLILTALAGCAGNGEPVDPQTDPSGTATSAAPPTGSKSTGTATGTDNPSTSTGPAPTTAPPTSAGPPSIQVSLDKNVASFSYTWSRDAFSVQWDFGDGTTSSKEAPTHRYSEVGSYTVRLTVGAGNLEESAQKPVAVREVQQEPHVIVGVPDSGVNPYHEIYYRPDRTEHPCTYIEDFPCGLPALDLSIGEHSSWQAAFEADKPIWQSIRPGDAFWIPKTVFVAVICEEPYEDPVNGAVGDLCIIDDSDMHGTGTTSSVLSENPDALIAFKEGRSSIEPFRTHNIPVDIYSVSWGNIVPIPTFLAGHDTAPIYVVAAGNDPRSTLIDGWAGDPRVISVGGAYAQSNSEEGMAAKQPDVVSYYCRPTAQTESISGTRDRYCGTSFAAPTVAGGLSKVVLELRRESGYTGSVSNGMVDPILGVSVGDVRDALNRTASYDPSSKYSGGSIPVPLNPAAPYLQWGWGFYDGNVADATIKHMLGIEEAPEKSADAVLYMETMHAAKELAHL